MMALEAKESSVENSDVGDVVEMEDFWCSDIDGANAFDVLARDAARRTALAAENSFMVVVILLSNDMVCDGLLRSIGWIL